MPPTLIVDDRHQLVKSFVTLIEEAAAAAVAERGHFAMAVTGGRDAAVLRPALLEARVDWTRTDIFWGDERAVPATHPDSNYGQIKAAWLDRLSIPPAQAQDAVRGDQPPDLPAARVLREAARVVVLAGLPSAP